MKEVASWRMEWLRRVNMIYDVAKKKTKPNPNTIKPLCDVQCISDEYSEAGLLVKA